MKVFITGGSGFVGANIIRQLIATGIEVRALVRPHSDRRNFEGLAVELVEADLSDEGRLVTLMAGCEWAFHTAAHYSLCRQDKAAIYAANVTGTKNILAAAKRAQVKRLVYTSSVAAIGVAPEGQIGDEHTTTTLAELISDYKRSKFLAEQAALQAAQAGLPVVIVNPSTPIGPYDVKPTPTGDIILKFLKRQMPVYVHTGLNIVDVRDVAQGHLLAAEKGRVGERYILGNQNVTLKELLDRLAAITGLSAPQRAIPHFVPILVSYLDELVISPLLRRAPSVPIYGAQMARHAMYYNSAKAVQELGLPQTPIDTALRDAVEWFRRQGYV
jgi:dihydroflavonol-4-reductase